MHRAFLCFYLYSISKMHRYSCCGLYVQQPHISLCTRICTLFAVTAQLMAWLEAIRNFIDPLEKTPVCTLHHYRCYSVHLLRKSIHTEKDIYIYM